MTADPDPSEELRAKLNQALVGAISPQGQQELSVALMTCFTMCETMRRGLPQVIEALDTDLGLADIEAFRLRTGGMLRYAKQRFDMPDEVAEGLRTMLEDGYTEVLPLLKNVEMLAKSMRAIAKTQLASAAALQAVSISLFSYIHSGSFAADAAKSACRTGAGTEAVQALFQAKLAGK